MERLEPFEKLEGDYYLDERNGWYSDNDHWDSDSSDDDEFRQKVSKLAGVRQDRKSPSCEALLTKNQKKDEFESDMDDDLNEQLVAHASQFMISSSQSVSQPVEKDEDTVGLSLDGDNTEEQKVITKQNQLVSILRTGSDDSFNVHDTNPSTSQRQSKRVSIKMEPHVTEYDTHVQDTHVFEEREDSNGTPFDDRNNLLRRAADKVRREDDREVAEFYDPNEDEDNEKWVQQHRERLKIIAPATDAGCKSTGDDWENDADFHDDNQTDAVLSCPACMTLLTRDCQRHVLYKNQYRAIFVENCKVVTDKLLFLPQQEERKRKRGRNKDIKGPRPKDYVMSSDLSGIPKEDLFHPVQCSICSLNVGVLDHEEIYHFFDVLTGYA